MNIDTLISAVENWADQRGLLNSERVTILAQMCKTQEELGETSGAILKENHDKIIDGIGDVAVCLIILASQHGLRFEKCLEHAYNEIKDRKGTTSGGTFVKEEPNVEKCEICFEPLKDCVCG